MSIQANYNQLSLEKSCLFLAKYTGEKPCIVRPNEVKTLKSLRIEDAVRIIEHDNKKELLKQADDYIRKNSLSS
jgi:hypothetical protein